MRALEILLAHVVDYAGLFPPAALGMSEVARRYVTYAASDERWMLGRLVVPAPRLRELAHDVEALPNDSVAATLPWRVSALLGAEPLDDVVHLAAHRADGSARALVVDAVEVKGASSVDIDRARRVADEAAIAAGAAFVEVPWDADHAVLAAAARAHGVALKLRTGGVTADAFPEADVVARFMASCVAAGVPFKLTAGLHHPLRGEHPLTYEPGCARGTMHGFLNVLAAATLLAAGHRVDAMLPLLEERDAAELTFGDEGLAWRGREARLTAVHTARRLLRSFGSCSFDEPVEQLRALGLLPATQPSHAP